MLPRLTIIVVYTAVFWVLLPLVLWTAGAGIDALTGVRWDGSALGSVPATLGVWLLGSAMVALWRRGGGLPISALPPPRLVVSGPYHWMRHPIYIGFDLAVLGVALMIGSPGLLLVSIGFLPLWVAYAAVEERGLARRFGRDWRRYTDRVGWVPNFSLVGLARLLKLAGRFPIRIEGAENIPETGPAVMVANHACYTDGVLVALLTGRRVWFPTTSEAFRPGGIMAWASHHWPSFPVRRYRVDPAAMARLRELLAQGEVVALFPERERSVLGRFLGPDPDNANILCRLGVPVIPVGLDGNYDCGPRWSRKLALRYPVTARIGAPVDWSTGTPVDALDRAMRAVLGADPQRVDLDRWPLERLPTAVWRCPGCGDEAGWKAVSMSCTACGRRWVARDGGVVEADVTEASWMPFADWADGAWDFEDGPLEIEARVDQEQDPFGPLTPLMTVHEGTVHLGPDGIRFGELELPLASLRTVTTERADTLQVATSTGMWQIVAPGWSAFRLQLAVKRWMPERSVRSRQPRAPVAAAPEPPAPALPLAGAAVGMGFAVAEAWAIVVPIAQAFGAAGYWRAMVPSVLVWTGVGAVVDALVGLGTRSPWIRGGAALAVMVCIPLAGGQPVGAVALVAVLGALWAASLRVPMLGGLAWCAAVWALSPALPRPFVSPQLRGSTVGAKGPDIAVIVLDTVPVGRTSGEGERDTTPNLNALGDRGLRFVNTRSPSCWSLPAHASMLTGLWPAEHGADYEQVRLDPSVPTLATQLHEGGYETVGFTANPLFAPGVGLGRGFERFEERWRRHTLQDALSAWRLLHRWTARDRDKQGSDVLAAVRDWKREREGDRPFFVMINLFEAHVPWQEIPASHRGRFTGAEPAQLERLGEIGHLAQTLGIPVAEAVHDDVVAMHDEAIRAADAYLGELLELFGEDTLVVVVSDHGEAYGQRGAWGHVLGLEEELLRVPLVMAGPGVDVGTDDRAASLVDLFPTVLGLAGVEAPQSHGLDLLAPDGGRSRVLRAEHGRTDLFTSGWQLLHPLRDHTATRARRWAVIEGDTKRTVVDGVSDEVFDLSTDPLENQPRRSGQEDPSAPNPWEGR